MARCLEFQGMVTEPYLSSRYRGFYARQCISGSRAFAGSSQLETVGAIHRYLLTP
jgi:hypothetical protein